MDQINMMPLKKRVSELSWRKQLNAAINSGDIELIKYFWSKHEEVFFYGYYVLED